MSFDAAAADDDDRFPSRTRLNAIQISQLSLWPPDQNCKRCERVAATNSIENLVHSNFKSFYSDGKSVN